MKELNRIIKELKEQVKSGIIISVNDAREIIKIASSFADVIPRFEPVEIDTAHEAIQNALYATGNFTTDQCEKLTEDVIMIGINEYELTICKAKKMIGYNGDNKTPLKLKQKVKK